MPRHRSAMSSSVRRNSADFSEVCRSPVCLEPKSRWVIGPARHSGSRFPRGKRCRRSGGAVVERMSQVLSETEFDVLRFQEFSRLDKSGSIYFDYTGAALYPASLIQADADRLTRAVLGNPH